MSRFASYISNPNFNCGRCALSSLEYCVSTPCAKCLLLMTRIGTLLQTTVCRILIGVHIQFYLHVASSLAPVRVVYMLQSIPSPSPPQCVVPCRRLLFPTVACWSPLQPAVGCKDGLRCNGWQPADIVNVGHRGGEAHVACPLQKWGSGSPPPLLCVLCPCVGCKDKPLLTMAQGLCNLEPINACMIAYPCENMQAPN